MGPREMNPKMVVVVVGSSLSEDASLSRILLGGLTVIEVSKISLHQASSTDEALPLVLDPSHLGPSLSPRCAYQQLQDYSSASWYLEKHGVGGGGESRVDLSFYVFPCFTVFWGPKKSSCVEKQHGKCHCHTPSVCPIYDMLVEKEL